MLTHLQDEEKVKLKGEVRRISPPSSSPAEHQHHLIDEQPLTTARSIVLSHREIRNTNRILWSSAEARRSSTGDTLGYSSVSVWMQMTTSLPTSRLFIFSSRCWISSLGMCVNWIWSLTFTRYVPIWSWQRDGILLSRDCQVLSDINLTDSADLICTGLRYPR